MMFFDAVVNDRMVPLFNGTPREVRVWLARLEDGAEKGLRVCVGSDLRVVSVQEYLAADEDEEGKGGDR